MSDGYQVIPQALRNAQKSFDNAANRWDHLRQKELPEWKMGDGDLGLLGRLAGVITDYNKAVDQIIGKTKTGVDGFRAASTNLDRSATAYEQQDETYYRKFGWVSENMSSGDVYRPSTGG